MSGGHGRSTMAGSKVHDGNNKILIDIIFSRRGSGDPQAAQICFWCGVVVRWDLMYRPKEQVYGSDSVAYVLAPCINNSP